MNKEMTLEDSYTPKSPCEKLNYKVGDLFIVTKTNSVFSIGSEVTLKQDNRSTIPLFELVKGSCNYYDKTGYVTIDKVTPLKEYTDEQHCPSHYNFSIQPWQYMESVFSDNEYRGYLRGNIIKYISRYPDKGGIVDLEKAKHYLEELIKWEQK